MDLQRFAENINGRAYDIEVARVSANKWRAQLVRRLGGPSAMMPFYGTTADEAAKQLSEWLTLAHRNVPKS